MPGSTFSCILSRILPGKAHIILDSAEYIVVFKKTASQEAIDEQAEQVDVNGGKVERKFSSSIMRVRCLCSHEIMLGSLILHYQGFSAEIPDTYLVTLQSNLSGDDNQIAYIGKGHPISWIEHDNIKHWQCRTRLDCNHTSTLMREVFTTCVIHALLVHWRGISSPSVVNSRSR